MSHPDHEKNRVAWNEMVEVHWKHADYKVREFLEGWCSLHNIELREFGDVSGKRLLHLMCQFGMDALSWARRGVIVTGVDISDASIKRAHKLKQMADLKAEFYRCDILDLVGVIDGKFDIVYQSYGTHCWICDLDRWAQVIAHYLKPGGFFFIIDSHPISAIYEDTNCSYLSGGPFRYSDQPDYCDRDHIIESELVEFQHPLSAFVNALIGAGLVIERMDEYDKGYYPVQEDWYEQDGYWYPPGGPPRYPLMFSLKARKPK